MYKFHVPKKKDRHRLTLALRTPRYDGQLLNPRRKLQTFDRNKLWLLRTYGHLSRSRQHNFIVLTIVITYINQHLSTFRQNYSKL